MIESVNLTDCYADANNLGINGLYRVCKEQNKTVIIVTHNKAISIIADRIIRVSDGEIVSNEEIANPKQASEIEF